MQRISYTETGRNCSTIDKCAEFIFDNFSKEEKDYYTICERFKQYKFNDFVNEIRYEFNCQSISKVKFSIFIEYEDENIDDIEINLFFSTIITIPNRYETTYELINFGSDREISGEANDLDCELDVYEHKRFYVKAKVNVKFYINYGLNMYEDNSDEEDDNIETPKLELAFRNDKCSVCLDNEPNVLILPCLHIAICSFCDNIGKLSKCSFCREKILRKIKI